MTKFFNKFKKPCFLANFWSIFPILGAKKNFLENLALPCTTLYEFLAPCQNLEKNALKIPRKHLDRRIERRTYGRMGRPYFIGPFRLLPGVQ